MCSTDRISKGISLKNRKDRSNLKITQTAAITLLLRMVFAGIIITILFSCNVIVQEQVQSYSFSYSSSINTVYGIEEEAKSTAPTWTGDPEKVAYSLKKPSFSKIVDAVVIDPVTGIVSVQNSADATHEIWTVIASVDDSTYNAEIEIFVNPKQLESLTLVYEPNTVEINRYVNIPPITPKLSGCPEGIKVSYLMEPELPDGLIYSQTSGTISGILTAVGMQPTDYTITARTAGNYQGTAKANLQLRFDNKPSWIDSVEYDVSDINIELNGGLVVNEVNIAAPRLEIKTGRIHSTTVFSTKDNRISFTPEGAIVIAQGEDLSDNDGESVTFIILIDEETGVYAQEFTALKVNIRKVDDIVFNTAPTPTYGDKGVSVGVTVIAVNEASEAVDYSSSNESIVTVDQDGVLTIKAAGEVTITATSDFDSTVTSSQTIVIDTKKIDSLVFAALTAEVYDGVADGSHTISAASGLENEDSMTDAVDFTQLKQGPVLVNEDGSISISDTVSKTDDGKEYSVIVKGKGNYSGEKTLTLTLRVLDRLDSGSFSYQTGLVKQKDNKVETAVDIPADSTGLSGGGPYTFALVSSDISGVSIDDQSGTVSIPAAADLSGIDSSFTVKVKAIPKNPIYKTVSTDITVNIKKVTGIVFNTAPTPTYGAKGVSVGVTVSAVNGASEKVSYSSSNESIVTVDQNGVLTIKAAGEVTITAASVYDPTVTAAYSLNVQAVPLTSLSYDKHLLEAVYNTAITDLTAAVEPADAADKVNFSIDSSFNDDTGLSFDTNSGRISGTPTKLLGRKDYTVTITGKAGTGYKGARKTVSIQVSVTPKDIADTAFAMTFDGKSDANEGAATDHSADSFETDGLIAEADYELTIAGPGGTAVDAVTIDNDGNINIGSGIDKGNTGLYSVKATGINNYTGEKEAAFTLTVRRKITGISFTDSTLSLMPDQTMTTLTPTLTTGEGNQQDDDYITYTISPNLNTNTGLTFNPATGTISGTATTESPSTTYTITVVPDAGHYTSTATATVNIEVTEALSATYSNIDATVKTSIGTAGPSVNNDNWDGEYSATLPDGLTINEDNGNIDGAPTKINSTATSYTVNLTGTGLYNGVDATATVTITVDPKPITSVTYAEVDAVATVEIASPVEPTVLPDGAKVRYALADGVTLPGGLNLDPDSGAIEGTPEAGTKQDLTPYTILVSGTGDWLGSDIQATVNIKIDTAPEISASYDELSITIRDTVDVTYSSITSGETATFTMASGESLPAGLTLESDGRITGTATSITGIKTYHIVLTSTGRSGTAFVVITVKPKAITSVSYDDISAVYNTAIITPVAPTKNPSGLTATYSSANLPTGLTVDSNGVISGQPTILQTTATESTITITGTGDWAGRSTTAAVNIRIGPKALSDVSGFSISGSETVTALTSGSAAATVAGGLTHTNDYTLSIDKGGSPVAAVTINNAGNITIDSTITVNDAGTYTITAAGQGNYTGTKTGTFTLTVDRKALVQSDLGSISNAQSDFEITAGSGSDITRTLNFNGALAGGIGTDYTVGITAPSGAVASRVSLNSNTGELTISADIVPDDSGTYTVTATGQGNYKDTASATFVLTVTAASVSIEYSSTTLTASYGEGITAPTPTITPSGADISYSISPNLKTNTGLDFDTNTGKISGTPSSLLSTTKYTVSITGKDGTKYDGATDSFDVDVTVEQRDIEGTLSYSHINTTYGTEKAVNPQWTGGLTGQTVIYAINPAPPSGMTFVQQTGALSVTNLAAVSVSGIYTITATGTSNYKGPRTFEVLVTVKPKALTDALLGTINNDKSDFTIAAGSGSDSTIQLSFSGSPKIGSDFTLAITGRPQGATETHVSLDSNNELAISKDVVSADSGTYTLTATATDTGNYSGTATATLVIAVKIGISGTFSYADLEITNEQTIKSSEASWINAASGQTVKYALLNPPAGISIEENSGVVTVDTSVLTSREPFTIQAEGIGLYTGKQTASLRIVHWIPSDVTFTYPDIYVSTGSSGTSSPQWNSGSYDVQYSMVPLNGGTLPNEINIEPSSGKITVSSSAALQADTVYQVTATGTGSWKGWKKAKIRISVYDKFYYEFKPALVGQGFSLTPSYEEPFDASSFGQFTPASSLPPGLTLNSSSGEISGTPTTRQLAKEYTITATPTGGGATISNKVYLFIQEKATDMTSLWTMIQHEISAQGNEANLNLIDTSSITNMNSLFASFVDFNGDLSEWDVSSVTNMEGMFRGAAAFNGDLSKWTVSKVTNMKGMFRGAKAFNGDLSNWDVSSVGSNAGSSVGSSVGSMEDMFRGATNFNGDLSGWDVSSVINMRWMFYGATNFTGDLSGWDVSRVTGIEGMFNGAAAFNGDLSGWDVSSVTDMSWMFQGAKAFNGDLSGWNVSNVTDMGYMFNGATNFNGDLSGWDVSNVTNMKGMFWEAAAFNGDLSGWDVSSVGSSVEPSVGSMEDMFRGATNFNGDLSGWNVFSVTDMTNMFWNAKSFNGDLSNWDVSSVTNMRSMFSGASVFNGDLSGWDVSKVTNMRWMFNGAANFNRDLSGWDVSSVTSVRDMFKGATSFNGNLEPWGNRLGTKVLMNNMFDNSGLADNPPTWYQP